MFTMNYLHFSKSASRVRLDEVIQPPYWHMSVESVKCGFPISWLNSVMVF